MLQSWSEPEMRRGILVRLAISRDSAFKLFPPTPRDRPFLLAFGVIILLRRGLP